MAVKMDLEKGEVCVCVCEVWLPVKIRPHSEMESERRTVFIMAINRHTCD